MIIILICCCCNGNGDSMTIDLVDDEIHGSAMIAWLVARGGWLVVRWNNAWSFLVHNCSMDSSVNRDYVFVDVRRDAGVGKNRERRKASFTPSVPTKIWKAAKFKIFSSSSFIVTR